MLSLLTASCVFGMKSSFTNMHRKLKSTTCYSDKFELGTQLVIANDKKLLVDLFFKQCWIKNMSNELRQFLSPVTLDKLFSLTFQIIYIQYYNSHLCSDL